VIRVLVVCLVAALVLVVWVVLDPSPSLDGAVLPPALLIVAVTLVVAAHAERTRGRP
jgi:hypothetical protein